MCVRACVCVRGVRSSHFDPSVTTCVSTANATVNALVLAADATAAALIWEKISYCKSSRRLTTTSIMIIRMRGKGK